MTLVAGVDGCKAGWFVVFANANTEKITDFKCVKNLADLFQYSPHLRIIAIDVPIGLLSTAKRGGRVAGHHAPQWPAASTGAPSTESAATQWAAPSAWAPSTESAATQWSAPSA